MAPFTSSSSIPHVKLSNCEKSMPVIGMGTSAYLMADLKTTKASMLEFIRVGCRHFDTVFAYGSEKGLGEAIKEAVQTGLIESRDEFLISTKQWCSFASPEQVVSTCRMSLSHLGFECVDMYLIHHPLRLSEMVRKTPVPNEIVYSMDLKRVWEAMEECKRHGLTKGIGVSKFSIKKLEELRLYAMIMPSVNRVEMNTNWQQINLTKYCKAKGIN